MTYFDCDAKSYQGDEGLNYLFLQWIVHNKILCNIAEYSTSFIFILLVHRSPLDARHLQESLLLCWMILKFIAALSFSRILPIFPRKLTNNYQKSSLFCCFAPSFCIAISVFKTLYRPCFLIIQGSLFYLGFYRIILSFSLPRITTLIPIDQ